MKRFLIVTFFAFILATPAFAGSVIDDKIPGWDKLDAEQQAQFKLQAAQAAKAAAAGPVKPEDVKKWVEVGKSVGVGFTAAAGELGMGVDKLMSSDTGKIAMFLIVWNYIGDQLLGVFGGILWFIIMLPGWAMYARQVAFDSEVVSVNGKEKLKYSLRGDGSAAFVMFIALVIISTAGFVMIFA